MQKETYLPVIVDPSHAAGRRDLIFSLSCASVAVGACGLIVEVHHNPSEALVDAQQQITPDEFKELITACESIHQAIGNKRNGG
jgi:3-deoxy-7-phosphoheptulonate synthase